MRNYAVIPTYNRPKELARLVNQLHDDGVICIIIDNGSTLPFLEVWDDPQTVVLHDDTKPPQLYRFWNLGLQFAEENAVVHGAAQWNVGIFNDDALVPQQWWKTVEFALRCYNTPSPPAIACTHPYRPLGDPIVHVTPNRVLHDRMCPWAFMLRGELSLRADERFKWWWGDTDFEWQATLAGGVLIVPGPLVINEHADSTTHGELMEQAGRDGVQFQVKWGQRPW